MRSVVAVVLAVALFAAAAVVCVRRFQPPAVAVATITRRPAPPPRPPRVPMLFSPVEGLGPVLSTLTPMPEGKVTGRRLAELFPAFTHAPYDVGFCPVSLPFRYDDPDGVGNAAEANALAFLLGDALDWAPGNYSARHAYFGFEREPDAMRQLARRYDPSEIAGQVDRWGATHAVGGLLRRSLAGYAGTLEVYAADGSVAFTKDYADARPYADLLGDMAVDAIGFFGPPPTAELAAYLHQPRCRHASSLARLGSAAFRPRTKAFPTYAAILRDDPTFAEVRYWYANQKGWVDDGDGTEEHRQIGRSLHDRLTPTALVSFDRRQCPDVALAAEYPAWVERATRLAGGPDAPLSACLALDRSSRLRPPSMADVRRGLAAAAANPNRAFLLNRVTECLERSSTPDAALAASVAVTALNSRFQDPTGTWSTERDLFARAADLVARPDLAMAVRPSHDEQPWVGGQLRNVVESLCAAARWSEAVSTFAEHGPAVADAENAEAAHWAAVAAATAGDAAASRALRSRWGQTFHATGMSALLDAKGPVDLQALEDQFLAHQTEPGARPRLLLAAELDVARGQGQLRMLVWSMLAIEPDDRVFWPLLDAYERRDPTELGTYFYPTLLTRFGKADPWARAANQAWVARGRPGEPAFHFALDMARASLADYPPTDDPVVDPARESAARRALSKGTHPFIVSCQIAGLRQRHEPGGHDLALRFRHLAVDVGDRDVASFAADLVRQTERDH